MTRAYFSDYDFMVAIWYQKCSTGHLHLSNFDTFGIFGSLCIYITKWDNQTKMMICYFCGHFIIIRIQSILCKLNLVL